MGVGRRLGGGLALSVAGTRKVCPDGVDSCGDPFRRSAMCIDQLLTFLFYGCSTVVRCVAVRCGSWSWLTTYRFPKEKILF